MFSSSNISLYVCLMLTIVGLIFSTIAYRSWNSTNKIIENGLKAEGVVTGIIGRKDKQKRTTGTQAPVLRLNERKKVKKINRHK